MKKRAEKMDGTASKTLRNQRRRVERSGLDPELVERRKRFFRFKNGALEADEKILRPTGIVLGMPLNRGLASAINAVRKEIKRFFIREGLARIPIYFNDPKTLHATLLSYSHYEDGRRSKVPLMPTADRRKMAKIISETPAVTIRFNGLQVMPDGAIIIKCEAKSRRMRELRRKLAAAKSGRKPRLWALHATIGSVLQTLPAATIKRFHHRFGSRSLGMHKFLEATGFDGTRLPFREDAPAKAASARTR